MVLLIIIPIKWLFHWEYTLFSDKPKYSASIASRHRPWPQNTPPVAARSLGQSRCWCWRWRHADARACRGCHFHRPARCGSWDVVEKNGEHVVVTEIDIENLDMYTLCTYVYTYIYICIYICVCMYVCMYVCVSVCLSVCLYVCMYVCMYVCT